MPTEAEVDEAFEAGVASAEALFAESSGPLLVVDEFCADEFPMYSAKGWSLVFAGPESSRRCQAYRESNGQSLGQAIQSSESLAEKIVGLMAAGSNSKSLFDIGYRTADAVRQPDGSWEVDGQGGADLSASMAVSAERKARKVSFLPRQVERKIARSVRIALVITGQITLCDGTVIRSANSQGFSRGNH